MSLRVCSYTCRIVLDSVLVSTNTLRKERREIFRECGCDHVKTSSYPCNTSSDVFSIKPVTSARLCFDPNPARAIRHRQEISRKKKRLGRYWITFFFQKLVLMTGCGVICQATARLTALAPLYFLLQSTLNAPVYPDVINLIISLLSYLLFTSHPVLFFLLHCQFFQYYPQ